MLCDGQIALNKVTVDNEPHLPRWDAAGTKHHSPGMNKKTKLVSCRKARITHYISTIQRQQIRNLIISEKEKKKQDSG